MTTTPAARFVASYQLFGDDPAEPIMNARLDLAVEKGDIEAYNVTGVYVGPWGIQLVDFTVDIPLQPTGRFNVTQTHSEAKEAATDLLNEVIGDSDVDVRWASTLRPATI